MFPSQLERDLVAMEHHPINTCTPCFAHACPWVGHEIDRSTACRGRLPPSLANARRIGPSRRPQQRSNHANGIHSCLAAEESATNEPLIVDLSPEIVQKTKKVRARTKSLIGEIGKYIETVDKDSAASLPPVELDEGAEYARTAIRAADQRKATDPVVIRIANVSYITTFMVCVTGNNAPQIRAIGNLVEEDLLKKHKLKPKRSTGTANSGWLLLDYGDMMVHIFSPEERKNYDLETLWARGEVLDIADCLVTASSKAVENGSRNNGIGRGADVQTYTNGLPSDDASADEDDWLA
jgi:ribosome-associated protein